MLSGQQFSWFSDICRWPFAVSYFPSSFLPLSPNAAINTNAVFQFLWHLPLSFLPFLDIFHCDFCHCDFCHFGWEQCQCYPIAFWDKCLFMTFAIHDLGLFSISLWWLVPLKSYAFLGQLPPWNYCHPVTNAVLWQLPFCDNWLPETNDVLW